METTKREKALGKILDDLRFFYLDLNHLIIDYDTPTSWEAMACTSWTQQAPNGLLTFQHNIYLSKLSSVVTCNTNGEIIQESLLKSTSGIDINEKNSMLYLVNRTHVTLLNLKLEHISSWRLPKEPGGGLFLGLKVDGHILYLTIDSRHQIFLCNSQDGKILQEFGTVKCGFKDGEFNHPFGVSVDNTYIYICDTLNNRVQIFKKENRNYFSKWQPPNIKFNYPYSIYNYLPEDIIYVGDDCSVQLFKKDGVCIQRLGGDIRGNQMHQFDVVFGMCVLDDRLYVSDNYNNRIQIFKMATK